jgi:TonB-dependent receptor
LIEKVSAGYIMQTLDISSRWRLVAGVRFEGTNLDTSSFQTIANCSVPVPANSTCPPADVLPPTSGFVKANGSYVKVLPSASLRYALTSNTNLRLAYGRGLSRPNPQDIAQAQTIDTTVNPNVVSLGNPNLKPESADNVDVLIEHYINPFGMITAGYFYKNLTDPIVTHRCGPPTICPAPFQGDIVTQPLNAGSAWINGFEAAYLQHLSFLPGMFRGLGFSANYGYTASRASLGPDFGRSDHPRLLRNAPHTWNISPTYDRGRVSARIGLSYNAANIAGYGFTDGAYGGITGPFGDNYFYAHLQFDAQGSVRLTRGLEFVMYGLNINNEVFGFYNGSPQYMVQREYYRPTIAAGMRWSPTHEK